MRQEHTPGPLSYSSALARFRDDELTPYGYDGLIVVPSKGEDDDIKVVARITARPTMEEAYADLRMFAAAPDLLAACESAIPKGVCLTNKNIPDDFTVALDCTMGDLRKLAAAIARARGNP